MKHAVALLMLAAVTALGAPVPSREIVTALDPNVGQRWQWAQGETVYITVTARVNSAARDLTGATCYGVLYSGTNVYLRTTGTVASATGGVFSCTVSAADSNVEATNEYTFAFWGAGSTSTAHLGTAAVTVKYAPDASAPRVAALDYVPTASIVTGAVYSVGGAALPLTNHVLWITTPAATITYGTATGTTYQGNWGADASNLAASALSAVASTGTAAAAANLATSNSIAGAISGYSYPLAWGVLASNLAASASGISAGDATNIVTGLAYPIGHGQAASNLAAEAVTAAQLAGATVTTATNALLAAEATHSTNADMAVYATSSGYATNAGAAGYATASGYATNSGFASSATAAGTATNWLGDAALTNALRTFATNAAQSVSLTWAQIADPPAVGTGDMTSNVFVSGSGVVGTATVAQVWQDGAATWVTQAAHRVRIDAAEVTNEANRVRVTAAEVTNESNRVRVTAAEVTNEANRVRIVAAEVTNEANRVRITAAEVTNATQEARFSGWTNSAALMTKTESGTQYFGIAWSSTNYWWRVYP